MHLKSRSSFEWFRLYAAGEVNPFHKGAHVMVTMSRGTQNEIRFPKRSLKNNPYVNLIILVSIAAFLAALNR